MIPTDLTLSSSNCDAPFYLSRFILFPSLQIYRNNSASYLLAKAQKLFEESLWLENSEKMSADKERENDHEFKEDNRLPNKGVPVSMANSDENESGNNVGSIRCPSDPTLAVYYLASNMIVHDKEKQQLLEAENIIIRLRYDSTPSSLLVCIISSIQSSTYLILLTHLYSTISQNDNSHARRTRQQRDRMLRVRSSTFP